MTRARSPLRGHHEASCRLSRFARANAPPRGLLYSGEHRVRYPLAALMIQKELGNCRHALSRRHVAGTMTVQSGYVSRPTGRA